ncbi:MAG TPA: hypothetical protein VJ302_33670 [Blastocatellia bacterium]|nr:hypothetical protein [Blastocatellia bacterium]
MKTDKSEKSESSPQSPQREDPELPPKEKRASKKQQIIALFTAGMGHVEDLAMITGSRPSYVASVLQSAGLMSGYFDLYTTTSHPMNVYSRFFAGRLGFKDEATAQQSIELIDRYYHQFELAADRAGQHHALMMAMTMFNRARWTGKAHEADIFRQWLLAKLLESELEVEEIGEDLNFDT